MYNGWVQALINLAIQTPYFLVLLGGIIVAIVFLRRCLKVSVMVIGGLAGLLLISLVDTFGSHLLLSILGDELGWQAVSNIMRVKWLFSNIVRAACLALIVVAAFAWRKPAEKPAEHVAP